MPAESIKHKAKIGAYWQFLNQFANLGMQFLIGIVMARLLTPEDYGITALPAIFFAIANVFIECGFSAAMVRKPDLTEKDLSTAFYYSTAVGVICYALMFAASPMIARFFDVPVLKPLIRVTGLSFLWAGFLTPQNILLNRKLDFRTPTIIAVISRVFMGVVGITTAYLGFGVWALALSSVSSSFVTVVLTWLLVRWTPKSSWSGDSFKYLWGFGNKMIVTFLIDRLYTYISPMIIGKFYSTTQLGVYNRAYGYAQLPAQQFTNLLHNVTYPVMSRMQDDILILRNNYRRMLKLSAFIVFPIMFLMAVLAKPLIVVLVTDKWIDCVPYLQLMCFAMMWYPIHSINLALLLVKGRSDIFLKLQIIKSGIGLLIMAITLPFGIVYFLMGMILSSLISLFINTYYTGKIISVGFLKQLKDMAPILLLCSVMAVGTYFITLLLSNLYLQLFVGGLVGLIIYVVGSYLRKAPEMEDVKYMLKRKS